MLSAVLRPIASVAEYGDIDAELRFTFASSSKVSVFSKRIKLCKHLNATRAVIFHGFIRAMVDALGSIPIVQVRSLVPQSFPAWEAVYRYESL
jgi:hypothetical protein